MADRETSRYIDEKAADWIARLDRGPLSDEEARAFEAWLDGDPRRRGALLRMDALSMLGESARALGPHFEPAPPQPFRRGASPAPSRRKFLVWGGAGAVAASIVALGVSAPARAITTGIGEVRLVTLDDGSTVMLNTQTSVRVRYSESERRVELLYGEVYFTIVQDSRRPFLVEVTGAHLRATQAMFRVRKLDGKPTDVLVNQGDVALGLAGAKSPTVMRANTRLILPPAEAVAALAAPVAISSDIVSRELAWREGKIAFEGERLDQAVAEFARYSRTRIEIADPILAREPITGLFSASDPVGFSRAAADLFDAKLEQKGEVVILSRGSPAR